MLLRNYDNIMIAKNRPVISGGTMASTDTTVFGDGHINIKDTSGVIQNIHISSITAYSPISYMTEGSITTLSSNTGQSNLICGSGRTPVTYDDYKLDEPFTTQQVVYPSGSHSVSNVEYDEENKCWIFTYQRSYTALQDITVGEIGIGYGHTFASGNNNPKYCLVYREVLETSIDVPANANFVISFTKTLYANPNKPADYQATVSVE